MSGVKTRRRFDDVVGDLGQRAVVGEGVGAQPDERVLGRDVELGQDQPGGLVDLGPVGRQPVPTTAPAVASA